MNEGPTEFNLCDSCGISLDPHNTVYTDFEILCVDCADEEPAEEDSVELGGEG